MWQEGLKNLLIPKILAYTRPVACIAARPVARDLERTCYSGRHRK